MIRSGPAGKTSRVWRVAGRLADGPPGPAGERVTQGDPAERFRSVAVGFGDRVRSDDDAGRGGYGAVGGGDLPADPAGGRVERVLPDGVGGDGHQPGGVGIEQFRRAGHEPPFHPAVRHADARAAPGRADRWRSAAPGSAYTSPSAACSLTGPAPSWMFGRESVHRSWPVRSS